MEEAGSQEKQSKTGIAGNVVYFLKNQDTNEVCFGVDICQFYGFFHVQGFIDFFFWKLYTQSKFVS